MEKTITLPLTPEVIEALRAGDRVKLCGEVLVMRDAAHKRLFDALSRGEALPVDVKNQVVYYMGPSPAREGRIIGSAGPTTSTRMDKYTPSLLSLGLCAMIGKGKRSPEDLGTEAVRRITVSDFPLIVAVDCMGNNLYEKNN